MVEKDIEAKVVNWAKKNGWLVLKLNNPWSRGYPDRLFISPKGDHVYIEFKKPGGRIRNLQEKRIRDLKSHGCAAYIHDNSDDAIYTLEFERTGLL